MKSVYFFINVPITESTEEAAINALRPVIDELKEKAAGLGLEVEQGKFFHAFSYSKDDARAHLSIPKIKGVTYNQIYKMVNSVQVVSFSVR